MKRVILTDEIVASAETYLPLDLKCGIARVLAPGCVDCSGSQPPLCVENVVGRKLMELFVLAGYYLHLVDTSGLNAGKFSFSLEQYDAMAHLTDDLRDLDGGREILRDFRRFLDILDREIKNELARKNDPFARLSNAVAAGLTPEVLEQLRTALEEARVK